MPHCHITEKTRCPTHANTCPTIFLGASAPPPPPTSHLPPPSSRVLRHPRTPARRGQERRRLRFDCSPETGDQGIRISTMASISNLGCLACGRGHRTPSTTGGEKGLGSSSHHWTPSTLRILKPPLTNEASLSSQLIVSNQKIKYSASGSRSRVCMALVDERVVYQSDVAKPNRVLAYDLVQGNLVTWNSFGDKSIPDPPTAVLLHGILGSGKNWGSFARRLAQEFPMWQFLLVDLRCHGDSALINKHRPHTVASAALDVLKLVGQLRLTPRVLVGHSFGGKVALSMVEQAAKPLARPVKVWVLDATPGKLCPGGHGEDRPGELITFLSKMPIQFPSKREVIDTLVQEGFSVDVAQWIATNLRPVNQPGSLSRSGFTWVFDLQGIMEMYNSYEETNLWEIVENVPRGVHINFLKAERSLHRWAVEDVQRIHSAEELAAEEGAGVQMHVLEDAGHWVHADNPDGLFRILASSFRGLRTQ